MGLKSIPMLNKSGISMHWPNVWSTSLRYQRYLQYSIHIFNLFLYLFNSNTFWFINKQYYAKQFIYLKTKKKKNRKFFYLGRSWVMKYNSWTIIYLRIYSKMTQNWNYRRSIFSKNNVTSSIKVRLFKLNKNHTMKNKYFFL